MAGDAQRLAPARPRQTGGQRALGSGYRLLLVTRLKPPQVASAIRDSLGVPSVSTPVRCVDGTAATTTQFTFTYPLDASSRFAVTVAGRAVPSVAGSNVHLVITPIRILSLINAAAVATLIVAIPLCLLLGEAAAVLPFAVVALCVNGVAMLRRADRVERILRAALPAWPESSRPR